MNFEENLLSYLPKDVVKGILDAQQKERVNSLILNTRKIKSEDFVALFPKVKKHPFINNVFIYDKNDYQFGKSWLFDNGVIYLIDTSSLLVSYLLSTEKQLVDYFGGKKHLFGLDMCSAPGGKLISFLLRSTSANFEFIANDLNFKRVIELEKNVERQGFDNVIIANNDLEKIDSNFENTFDLIILDAPCSGSAMFRKNEQALKERSMNKVLKFQSIQKRLLSSAIKMLNKGGFISYSTCSFSKEENEDVILDIIKSHPDIEVIDLSNNKQFYRHSSLPQAIHLFPNLYEGEGQFICILHKKGVRQERQLKKSNKNTQYDNILKELNLSFLNTKLINGEIFANNNILDLSKLNVIKPGLDIGTYNKGIFTPSFHLAHFLDTTSSIKLNEEEFKSYLHGDQIKKELNLKNGFYTVSYLDINLGYTKYVNGQLKNFYPKGLRH